MARNSEKAMTALARWRNAKMAEEGTDKKPERRPYLATHCDNVKEAEKWRLQIIREISKKVSQIQNAGLGEFRIRDLNDEINKLLREKRHWEARIVELGGDDLKRKSRMLDREGQEVPGSRGYKYFGAARELPGVRELFENEAPAPPKKTRAELMRDIDASYYGFRDDDDGKLIPLEVAAETAAIEASVRKWKEKKNKRELEAEELEEGEEKPKTKNKRKKDYRIENEDAEIDEDIHKMPEMTESDRMEHAMEAGKEARYVSYTEIPSQEDIKQALLRRKKRELLMQYNLEDDGQDENTNGEQKVEIDSTLKDEIKSEEIPPGQE